MVPKKMSAKKVKIQNAASALQRDSNNQKEQPRPDSKHEYQDGNNVDEEERRRIYEDSILNTIVIAPGLTDVMTTRSWEGGTGNWQWARETRGTRGARGTRGTRGTRETAL